MNIVVASGKGGTGKTSIAVNLAVLIAQYQLPASIYFMDCDIEAPNAALFLHPTIQTTKNLETLIPEIDPSKCSHCGLCAQVCQFHALIVLDEQVIQFSELCHSCGSCSLICPLHAISEKPIVLGKIEKGMVNNLHFLQGVMNIGRSSPVGIINRMFEELFSDHSEDLQNSICIIDAPPGVSCPVVASLQSADLVILVAEPTPFVLVDADVDASNLELVIPPIKKNRHPFFGGKSAVIDQALCTHCEHCKAVCRFHAVKASGDVPVTYSIDPMKCEGCAVCVLQCSSNAIQLDPQQDGFWFESACIYGTFYHAHLFPGHSNSGKLVSAIISAARQTAHQDPQTIILVDGSPGIGCPVIAACNQSDLSVIVTEPTLSGIHDFERIVDTTLHFKIPTFMIINKADLDKKNASRILKLSRNLGVQFLGSIPFDSQFTQAMLMAESITIYDPCSPSSLAVTEILHFLEQLIF